MCNKFQRIPAKHIMYARGVGVRVTGVSILKHGFAHKLQLDILIFSCILLKQLHTVIDLNDHVVIAAVNRETFAATFIENRSWWYSTLHPLERHLS
jgi:hypothetical protein